MADMYQNKYRIPSARLQTWDYSCEGAYFITICTKNRTHYFGEVINNQMTLSNVGVLADVFWHEIKNHSKNISLGEFVVMPNHIHGILIINPDADADKIHENDIDDDNSNDSGIADANINDAGIVQTRHALSHCDPKKNPDGNEIRNLDRNTNPDVNEFHQKSIGQKRFRNPEKNSISSIIGGYKSAVTKHANRLNLNFGWQTRFYDHIIKDGRAFDTISNYIINNPAKWAEDKFHS